MQKRNFKIAFEAAESEDIPSLLVSEISTDLHTIICNNSVYDMYMYIQLHHLTLHCFSLCVCCVYRMLRTWWLWPFQTGSRSWPTSLTSTNASVPIMAPPNNSCSNPSPCALHTPPQTFSHCSIFGSVSFFKHDLVYWIIIVSVHRLVIRCVGSWYACMDLSVHKASSMSLCSYIHVWWIEWKF